MSLKILTTGGTIDGYLNPGDAPRASAIPSLIEKMNLAFPVFVESMLRKESRDINDEDRRKLLEACRSCAENRVIITHGTITMTETAIYLGKQGAGGKTIVLTGAKISAGKEGSDAELNLGAAVMATFLSPPGVYIAMNGKLFYWNNVRKNPETGYFEEIHE